MYDEMAIVGGKNVAQGSSAKSFDNVEIPSHGDKINVEEEDDGDSQLVKDNDQQSTASAPVESRKTKREIARMI